MRKFTLFALLVLLTSCSPFGKTNVIDYKTELSYLVSKFQDYPQGNWDRDDISEYIIADVRRLNIDLIVKNGTKRNRAYSGFVEENDSLVIFIDRGLGIIDIQKRIIYDFSKQPRNFANSRIDSMGYEVTQVDERWYYSEKRYD